MAAGGDDLLGMKKAAAVGAALLFMGAGTNGYDAFSAVMSSPWSTEKFTQTAEDERKGRRYVRHAIVISGIYAGVGTALAFFSGGWKLAVWPLAGFVLVTVYMRKLYSDAISRSPRGCGGSTADEAPEPTPLLTVSSRPR